LVIKHRNHPALLMWNLGNEVNYPLVRYKRILFNFFNKSYYKTVNSFINTFNELVDIIHREDPNHPVSTALIKYSSKKTHASIYLNSPEIDLLSYNTFGPIEDLTTFLENNAYANIMKPYYISEWGPEGPWNCEMTLWNAPIEATSTKKAELIKARYKIITEIKDETCLGSLVFFWGEKHETTATWFSLFLDDYKSEIISELENLWKKSNTHPTPIGLYYMLVDGKGARDTIIFEPNELVTSEIIFNDYKNDSVRIKWEICPEVWYQNKQSELIIPPKKIVGSFRGFEKNKATFITSSREGPYRIFAYVYDQNGFFATTNTPFYVLNNK